MNVVIADDEQIILRWLRKNLEELLPKESTVEAFANGKAALEYCMEHPADLLFTDIRMPVMDGIELLGQLRRSTEFPYVVVLSAFSEFSYVRDAFKLGASDYLLKTEITKDALKNCIDHAAERKRASDIMEPQAPASLETLLRIFLETGQIPDHALPDPEEEFAERIGSKYRILLFRFHGDPCSEERMTELAELALGGTENRFILISPEKDETVFFLSGNAEDPGSIQRLSDTLYAFGIRAFSAVYSSETEGWDGLGRAWNEVIGLKKVQDFFGSEMLLTSDILSANRENCRISLRKSFESVSEIIGRIDGTELRNEFEPLFSKFRNQPVPPEFLKQQCSDFLQYLYWNQIPEKERAEIGTEGISAAAKAETLSEFKDIFLEQLTAWNQLAAQERNKIRYSKSIQQVIEYMTDHYQEEITLNDLAGYVHLNRSYLSTSFKKEVGENINVFLALQASLWVRNA